MVAMMVDLCGVRLRNPLVLASGIWGSCAGTLVRVGRAGAGAVTAKSCSLAPRAGHPNPTVLDWGGGLINAVGLANPGAEAQVETLRQKATRIGDKAEKAGDLRTALQGVRELVRIVELLARLQGELQEAPIVNILLLPEWVQVQTVLLAALAPFPDARAAAAQALLELDGQEAHRG